ncbi:hypothetical protein Plec18170_008913 [Paecilomyces lecythidis]
MEYETILGMGTICEAELYRQMAEWLPKFQLNLWIWMIPGANGRRYLGFLELPDFLNENFQLSDGDTLKPILFTPFGSANIILMCRWDKNTGWITLDFEHELHPMNPQDYANASEVAKALERAIANNVAIRLELLSRSLSRQVVNLNMLGESHIKEQVLLGNDYCGLRQVDMYATAEGAGKGGLIAQEQDRLHPQQQEAARGLHKLTDGIGLIQGPPGTGKTLFTLLSILPLLLY